MNPGLRARLLPTLRRLRIYLAEMYPLPRRAAAAALIYGGVSSLLARLGLGGPDAGWGGLLLGSWAVFAFMLVLRLMDELKDVETDRALFPWRPLPSGRVLESDVAASLRWVAGLFLVAHLAAGWALLTALLALGYAWLMLKWFFVPDRMRASLPLTLATHNPVVPLLILHLVTLHWQTSGAHAGEVPWESLIVLVMGCWAVFFAWEIARKIRAPESEDAYVTYSRLLGPRGAAALSLGAQTLGLAAGLLLFTWHELSPGFLVPLIAGYSVALVGSLRFLVSPGPFASRLRHLAEADLFGLFLAGVLA